MITTYINSEKTQDYTVLFNKASAKLGLLPIVKEVRNPVTHVTEKEYWKRVWDDQTQVWTESECEKVLDEETGKYVYPEIDTATDSFKDIKPIASLNEYFQHIKDLAALAIGQGRSGSDPYFLRLPLDEPFFEINANTRGITVPGELSQIAVKGDKLAEVVFFRIDRYYDAVDLNTRHIYIEWEAPDGKGGVIKGISRDFLRDTQSEKDKLIFGWVIGDELTQHVGTIKFAVRFVEWFDGPGVDYRSERDENSQQLDNVTSGAQLLYSFSSLPATVSVVDSLNYSLWEDDEALKIYSNTTSENVGTMIYYLEDSDSDTPSETAPELAALPVFVRNLDKDNPFYESIKDKIIPFHENEYKVNLVDKKLELQVSAWSPDGGFISYVFGRIEHTDDEGTGIKPTSAAGLVAQLKFVPAVNVFTNADTAENNDELIVTPGKTFYIQDNTGAFLAQTSDELKAIGVDGEFWEKVAYATIALPGHYYAIADNKSGGHKVNSQRSKRFYVPWAAVPDIETPIQESFVINRYNYNLVPDTDYDENTVDHLGFTNVRVQKTQALDFASYVRLSPIVDIDPEGTEGLSYQWYRQADNHWLQKVSSDVVRAFTRPTGEVEGEEKLSDDQWAAREAQLFTQYGWELIPDATNKDYDANEPGLYAVKITNDFNNDKKATDLFAAGICRVTRMPQMEAETNVKMQAFYDSFSSGHRQDYVELSIGTGEDQIDFDEIVFQWHKVTPEDLEDDEKITGDDVLTPTLTLHKSDFNNGVYRIPFQPQSYGGFFLTVTNNLNGASAIYNSGDSSRTIRIFQS